MGAFTPYLWKLAKVFLDPHTANKVVLLEGGGRPASLGDWVPEASTPSLFRPKDRAAGETGGSGGGGSGGTGAAAPPAPEPALLPLLGADAPVTVPRASPTAAPSPFAAPLAAPFAAPLAAPSPLAAPAVSDSPRAASAQSNPVPAPAPPSALAPPWLADHDRLAPLPPSVAAFLALDAARRGEHLVALLVDARSSRAPRPFAPHAALLAALPTAREAGEALLTLPTASAAGCLVELRLMGDYRDVAGAMGKGASAAVEQELKNGALASVSKALLAAKGLPKDAGLRLVGCRDPDSVGQLLQGLALPHAAALVSEMHRRGGGYGSYNGHGGYGGGDGGGAGGGGGGGGFEGNAAGLVLSKLTASRPSAAAAILAQVKC